MIGEDIPLDQPKQLSGWEDVAEMADTMPTKYEVACTINEQKIKSLQEEKYPNSSLATTFKGFTETCHDKSADCIDTAANRTIELSKNHDPEIELLLISGRAGISGGRYYSHGERGTGEYIYETLGSKCSPQDIGLLETISKTIPSSDFAKYENMRLDAYRIQDQIIGGRSFIHDCAPEAHRLIDAMVDYYDAKDNPEQVETKRTGLSNLLSELRVKHGAGYLDPHENYIFDLAKYDQPAKPFSTDGPGLRGDNKTLSDSIYDGNKGNVKAIDILRRLKKNMEPTPLTAPHTKIPELNDAFTKLDQVPVNKRTGEFRISVDELSDVLGAINHHLIDNQGQRNLYPSTISAITYIDKLSASALKNLSEKDWQEMPFDPTFKEMLRFSQLTMSGGYSQDDFEKTYNSFVHQSGEAFKEDSVDNAKISEAYKIIQAESLRNAKAVADQFSDNPNLEYLASAVWSGNLTHELIGLAEKY